MVKAYDRFLLYRWLTRLTLYFSVSFIWGCRYAISCVILWLIKEMVPSCRDVPYNSTLANEALPFILLCSFARSYSCDLNSRYDETAYRALSEASWQLFRKPRMQTQTYPILIGLAALTLFALISGWGRYSPVMLVGAGLFVVLLLAAIPLSGMSAKAKMCRAAVKAAASRGEFPADIQFTFGQEAIRSKVGGHVSVVKYSQATGFAALGEWSFLFFGQAAYIFHSSAFASPEEAGRFRTYIQKKCGTTLVTLKGTGPQR